MLKLFDEFDLDLKKVEEFCLYSDDGTSNLTGGVTGGTTSCNENCGPSSSCSCSCMCPTQLLCRE